MIVAKETAAAVNHSDEYALYTALLTVNSADLSALLGRALGPTTATRFQHVWDMQNSSLVDYAIGLVTHDDSKANAAMAWLNDKFFFDFGDALGGLYQTYKVTMPLDEQVQDDKTFIDYVAAQKYASFYSALHEAYSQVQAIGDALANEIVNRFPDKFPGRIDGRDVIDRVTMNLLLQEHSYLATMATDAAIGQRSAEKTAALSALGKNSAGLTKPWTDWDAALVSYATGADFPASPFIDRLAAASGAPKSAVQYLVQATIKVVDDQRSKSSKTLADDDRAAATAMQPIADRLAQG